MLEDIADNKNLNLEFEPVTAKRRQRHTMGKRVCISTLGQLDRALNLWHTPQLMTASFCMWSGPSFVHLIKTVFDLPLQQSDFRDVSMLLKQTMFSAVLRWYLNRNIFCTHTILLQWKFRKCAQQLENREHYLGLLYQHEITLYGGVNSLQLIDDIFTWV